MRHAGTCDIDVGMKKNRARSKEEDPTIRPPVAIQYHAKTHTDGISVSCHICSKILTNKQTLRQHISGNHSELFSCDICGKSGMKKANYYMHKRNNHQIKSA